VGIAAAPARVDDGGGKEERGGACKERKGAGEKRALHDRAESVAECAGNEQQRRRGLERHFLLVVYTIRLVLNRLDVNALG
jgi:hypothetical protein